MNLNRKVIWQYCIQLVFIINMHSVTYICLYQRCFSAHHISESLLESFCPESSRKLPYSSLILIRKSQLIRNMLMIKLTIWYKGITKNSIQHVDQRRLLKSKEMTLFSIRDICHAYGQLCFCRDRYQ